MCWETRESVEKCIDRDIDSNHDSHMAQVKRITANLPRDLLEDAIRVSGKGITDTLIEGLEMVRRSAAYEKAMALKGKVRLDIDLEVSRERNGG
jgi:hypothetical protein